MIKFVPMILMTAVAVGFAAPASARNYDCSKAGNANKAECKAGGAMKATATKTTKATTKAAAVKAAPAAAKAAPAPKAAAAKATTAKTATTAKATTTERNYDCTKAGNKNKAACKTAAPAMAAAKPAPMKPMAKPAPAPAMAAAKPAMVTKTTTVASGGRNYDCAKAGNANKAVCKTAPVAMAKPKAAAKSTASDDRNPAGAIGRCKDGFYSHSKQRTGACSRHGGVAQWS